MFNDPKVNAVYQKYAERDAADAARMEELGPNVVGVLNELLLSVGEDVAQFLRSMIIARKPKVILELGTSYGYSTLFLADAARSVGGRVITMELADYKQDYARQMMTEAGLVDYVDFRCGDALELLKAMDENVDFALLDIWKELYLPCFDVLYPKLSEEGIICADNMIFPPSARPEVRAYRAAVRSKPDLQTTLFPFGQGIELTVRWSDGNPNL